MLFGNDLPLSAPEALAGPVELLPGLHYPAYRLLIIGVGLLLALLLYLLVQKTAPGHAGACRRVQPRDGIVDGRACRPPVHAVFGIGAALCAVAGALLGPLLAVQVGMGENILILAFVVIVIGGIGSIRGALVGALLVGWSTPLGRSLLPHALRAVLPPRWPANPDRRLPRSRSTCSWRPCCSLKPQGLFPVRG
jgi:branched-chain amino acid transport system permease protein